MGPIRDIIDFTLRIFALGLFVSVVLNWILTSPANGFRKQLDKCYEPFLKPIRRYIKPIKLSPGAPVGMDLSPLVLLIAIWWAVHPFLMWVFGA